jgi:5-formyltetrahydrofolate cyclo-ligase
MAHRSPHPVTQSDAERDRAAEAKRTARRVLLARRRSLPAPAVAAASDAIVDVLRALPELSGGRSEPRHVLLYAADPDEVDLDDLIDHPPVGWTIMLPRVVDGTVVAVPHVPGTPLIAGHRGIREPSGRPLDAAKSDATIAAVIVPGVAFTAAGARLGRGAGMYDRLLSGLSGAMRIGVCMEAFVVDDLPLEPHDVAMDVLVTDASVRRRGDGGGAVSA